MGLWKLVDTTLREGEQFYLSRFRTRDKEQIAEVLSNIGVDIIELSNPAISEVAKSDCRKIAGLGLRSKLAVHIRCLQADVEAAIDLPVQGFHLFIPTSPLLKQHSIQMQTESIINRAIEVLGWVRTRRPELELRFSTEDSFRTPLAELEQIYTAIDETGLADRYGITDTVGMASPLLVADVVRYIRSLTTRDLEFHGHNDSGCAIANTFTAMQCGVTHADTCILGIGERNGIASLEGLLARMYVSEPELTKAKYKLDVLPRAAELVSKILGQAVPYNQPIVGSAAFAHKAGIHTNALIKDTKTYEIIEPSDFGRSRMICLAHNLVGSHAIGQRAGELGLVFTQKDLAALTRIIKDKAEQEALGQKEVDVLIRRAGQEGLAELLLSLSRKEQV